MFADLGTVFMKQRYSVTIQRHLGVISTSNKWHIITIDDAHALNMATELYRYRGYSRDENQAKTANEHFFWAGSQEHIHGH